VSHLSYKSILDWPNLTLCSISLPWRRLPCECSSRCRYRDLVDVFDSLFDRDTVSVSSASTDLKDMDHGSDLTDESKSLKCSGSDVEA
jgi:hypothetical protein